MKTAPASRLALFALSLALLLPGAAASAEAADYSFKDPKGVNGVTFVMDSRLEPILGIIGGVAGNVSYDPDMPESFTGEVSIDMATAQLINDTMTKHLKGKDWLNIQDQFRATMTFNQVVSSEAGEENGTVLQVDATLSFGGKTLDMQVPIEATVVPGGAAERGGAESGDLLVLRSMIEVSRLELGIQEETPTDKVGETIMVLIPIVGYSQ